MLITNIFNLFMRLTASNKQNHFIFMTFHKRSYVFVTRDQLHSQERGNFALVSTLFSY
jgi:hypothetical protein